MQIFYILGLLAGMSFFCYCEEAGENGLEYSYNHKPYSLTGVSESPDYKAHQWRKIMRSVGQLSQGINPESWCSVRERICMLSHGSVRCLSAETQKLLCALDLPYPAGALLADKLLDVKSSLQRFDFMFGPANPEHNWHLIKLEKPDLSEGQAKSIALHNMQNVIAAYTYKDFTDEEKTLAENLGLQLPAITDADRQRDLIIALKGWHSKRQISDEEWYKAADDILKLGPSERTLSKEEEAVFVKWVLPLPQGCKAGEAYETCIAELLEVCRNYRSRRNKTEDEKCLWNYKVVCRYYLNKQDYPKYLDALLSKARLLGSTCNNKPAFAEISAFIEASQGYLDRVPVADQPHFKRRVGEAWLCMLRAFYFLCDTDSKKNLDAKALQLQTAFEFVRDKNFLKMSTLGGNNNYACYFNTLVSGGHLIGLSK